MNIDSLFTITYGLYILSSRLGDKFNGHINNTCFQVTAEPPQFVVCTHKNNLTTNYIQESKVFSISVIQEDVDLNYIGHWGFKSGRDFDKFKDISFKIGVTGAPIILEKTVSFIECQVVKEIDVGTHLLFIGEVKDADFLNKEQPALTYHYYRNVIKGLSPKNSPTYVDKSKFSQIIKPTNIIETVEKNISKVPKEEYICSVCGYVYDPDEGDPTSGIKPGTRFKDLPDDWVCPICGVEKEYFNSV